MVRTGIATFHQVMPALTLLNSRMARKLIAVKLAMSRMLSQVPRAVTLPVSALKTPCQ